MSAEGANSGKTDEKSGEQSGEKSGEETGAQSSAQSGEKTGESAAVPKGLSNAAEPVAGDVSSNGAEPVVRDVSGNGAEPAVRDTPGASSDGDAAEPVVVDPVSAPDAEGNPRRATRRFPLFTRDTARPEGGGRAAPRDAPAPARQWPILLVLSLVALGLLLTAFDVFRYGTILIGVALLGGAALRWTLPDVGMLAVRSRFTDLVTYGVLGVAIVLLSLMAQPNPWLVIPFLDDTLHFTVR